MTEHSDAHLFATVVAGLRNGASYYAAMGDALRSQNYPSGSLFNWRPPLLYFGLALWPGPIPDSAYFTEVWAGLALAVAAFSKRLRVASVMLALALRELALPGAFVLALLDRRSGRRSSWMIGLSLVGVYYALHWAAVRGAQLPGDRVAASWVAFGGPKFVLSTLAMSPLTALGQVGAWIWLALLFAALFSPGVRLEYRAIVWAYLALFLIVGRPDNDYWTAVVMPIQCLAIGQWVLWLSERDLQTKRLRKVA